MKRIVLLSSLLLIFMMGNVFAQHEENRITIKTNELESPVEVVLSEIGESNQPRILGELEVDQEGVTLALDKVSFQTLNVISVKEGSGQLFFINENQPLTANLVIDEFGGISMESSVEGGEGNQQFSAYLQRRRDKLVEIASVTEDYTKEQLKDERTQQEILNKQSAIDRDFLNQNINAMKDHPDALASAYIFSDVMRDQSVSDEELKEIFDNFSDGLKGSYIGSQINNAINPPPAVQIGDQAPAFSAPSPSGEEISLQDILDQEGEVTLVEFWASWCPYCRREMPGLVKIYEEYKDKGFKIISISLDKDRDEWVEAIEEFGMDWPHVSNHRYWDEPIVRKYNVKSVPNNFLLDKDGKVIAIKMRSGQLKTKLQELLK